MSTFLNVLSWHVTVVLHTCIPRSQQPGCMSMHFSCTCMTGFHFVFVVRWLRFYDDFHYHCHFPTVLSLCFIISWHQSKTTTHFPYRLSQTFSEHITTVIKSPYSSGVSMGLTNLGINIDDKIKKLLEVYVKSVPKLSCNFWRLADCPLYSTSARFRA